MTPGSKPDSSEDPPCMWVCCTRNHTHSPTARRKALGRMPQVDEK
ncbi:hypothetical protein AVEN_257581-1, partial [Araneus ventricosus]